MVNKQNKKKKLKSALGITFYKFIVNSDQKVIVFC